MSDDSPAVQEVAQSAQRRQLTVMFCDLVDSTPMAVRLDPEDVTDVYRAFRDLCASTIQAAGGYVAKYMGDGVMAYFGFPLAHEDDAERAVHAAIGLAKAAPQLSTSDHAPLAARIGIATGLVVVGDVVGDNSAEPRDVVGETPNLASRLQGAASPNEILVSNRTQRLASDLFAFEDVGRLPLKGLDLKEPIWRVIGAKAESQRFSAPFRTRGPMLGRDAELQTLLARWSACLVDGVQVVGVAGEAGIGKSRLVDAFHRLIAVRQPHIWLEGGGAQIYENTPFYPVAQAIHRRLADGKPLTTGELLQRMTNSLALVGADGSDASVLIGELLGARPPEAVSLTPTAADQRRRALIDALSDWLLKSAHRWPTVLVIEDLQWVDPSTIDFLKSLMARETRAQLLIIYTTRLDDAAAWPIRETRIEIGRLARENIRNLIAAAAPRALAPDLLERVVARADGVPLFAEELAWLVGEDPGEAGASAIPTALSDLLMARLDQLGPAKVLAQVASVLGGAVPLPLLSAVAGVGEEALNDTLGGLVAAKVLVASDAGGRRTYAFRHALIEAAAYETLLKRVRRTLHRRAAQTIQDKFPDMAEQQPEVLAQHWLKAGDSQKAVSAWRRAARLAFGRYALREALNSCEQGIAIISSLKPSPEMERDEVALQTLLADAARGIEGYSSPRVLHAIERANALSDRQGGVAERMRRILGEWAAHSSAGDYEGAAKPGEAYIQLAQVEGGPVALGSAHMILLTRYRQGELLAAEQAYQSGKPYFEHPDFQRRAGAGPQVYGSAAIVAWLLGLGDEASKRSERSLAINQATGNPYDLVYACHMSAQLTLLGGAPAEAARLASESLRLAEAHGHDSLGELARVTLGRAIAALGRAEEGVALMQAALLGPDRQRSRGSQTMYLTWLAEAHAMAGDPERALAVIDDALARNPHELFFRPETLRIRGDLLRTRGRYDDAETDYLATVDLARSMAADTLVQRALSSLAGLRRAQNRPNKDASHAG